MKNRWPELKTSLIWKFLKVHKRFKKVFERFIKGWKRFLFLSHLSRNVPNSRQKSLNDLFWHSKIFEVPTIDLHGASLRKWSCFFPPRFSRFATQNNSVGNEKLAKSGRCKKQHEKNIRELYFLKGLVNFHIWQE